MLILINLLGIFVFLGVGALFSKNRKEIPWRIVAKLLVINIILAAFFNVSPIGRNLVRITAEGFTAFVNVAYVGIGYALPNWVYVEQMNFARSLRFSADGIPSMWDRNSHSSNRGK